MIRFGPYLYVCWIEDSKSKQRAFPLSLHVSMADKPPCRQWPEHTSEDGRNGCSRSTNSKQERDSTPTIPFL